MEYVAIAGLILIQIAIIVFLAMSIRNSIIEHRHYMEMTERLERELARTEEDEENISFFGQH